MSSLRTSKWYLRLEELSNTIEKIIEFLTVILLAILSFTVIFGVLTRNINIPIVWLGELGTFCCIWVTFLGMALAYRKKLFANVDLITHVLNERMKTYLAILWDVIGFVFLTLVLISSKSFIVYLFESGHKSGELRLSFWIVYIGPILGYIATAYYVLVSMIEQIINLKELPKTANEKSVSVGGSK